MLEIRHLDALCRAFTLLSHLALEHADRVEYALTAHYYAMRILSATFQVADAGYSNLICSARPAPKALA